MCFFFSGLSGMPLALCCDTLVLFGSHFEVFDGTFELFGAAFGLHGVPFKLCGSPLALFGGPRCCSAPLSGCAACPSSCLAPFSGCLACLSCCPLGLFLAPGARRNATSKAPWAWPGYPWCPLRFYLATHARCKYGQVQILIICSVRSIFARSAATS